MTGKEFKKALNGCSFKNTNILCIERLVLSKSLIETFRLGDDGFFWTGLLLICTVEGNMFSIVSIKSDDIVITNGVPEGSVLDPLLQYLPAYKNLFFQI